jgi:hypothetical protein
MNTGSAAVARDFHAANRHPFREAVVISRF